MATSHDDVYEKYDCSGSLWRGGHSPILFSEGGNFLLGVSRVASFLILYGLNSYNRYLLRTKTDENTNVIPSLILPYYFRYFQLFITLSFIAGILDLGFQLSGYDDGTINNWLIPLEQGFFHWLYEGLAFFLMRYGSGLRAMKMALLYSAVWGVITVILFFVLFSILAAQYGFEHSSQNALAVYLAYDIALWCFYAFFMVVPNSWCYRRDALTFYAKFNVVYYTVFILLGCLLYRDITNAVCPGSALVFIFVGFLQPLALFRTLQIDSRYWQGLTPDPRNPMLAVWDHVDIMTAQSMAENLETVKATNRTLPILHFGLLDIDDDNRFVPGGFSRVYFGKFRNKPVALKILFAMELTPDDVAHFYEEASLLHSLKHQNVVECMGICTMPPALAMVLESCRYGSLFDFIYKPVDETALLSHRRKSWTRKSFFSTSAISSLQAAFSSGGAPSASNRMSARGSMFASQRVDSFTDSTDLRLELTTPSFSSQQPPQQYVNSSAASSAKLTTEDDRRSTSSASSAPRPSSNRLTRGGGPRGSAAEAALAGDVENPQDNSRVDSVDGEDYIRHEAIMRSSQMMPGGSQNQGTVAGAAVNPMHMQPRASQLLSVDLEEEKQNQNQQGGASIPLQDRRSQRVRGSISLAARPSTAAMGASKAQRLSTFDLHQRGQSMSSNVSAQTGMSRAYESVSQFLSQVGNSISQWANAATNGAGMGENPSLFRERPSLAVHYTMAHSITLQDRIAMMRDAVAGIAFLHERGYLHCDIKSLNFLVDENFRVKLADLGESRHISRMATYSKPPTPARNWAPPEVILPGSPSTNYTTASEVYGVCIVLTELALLQLPFGELSERVTLRTWHDTLVVKGVRPQLPQELPPDLRAIIEQGLETDPEKRPTAAALQEVLEEELRRCGHKRRTRLEREEDEEEDENEDDEEDLERRRRRPGAFAAAAARPESVEAHADSTRDALPNPHRQLSNNSKND